MKLKTAIEKCFDCCNLDAAGDGMEIYKHMYQYKAIRDLPEDEFEKLYDYLSKRLGFRR